MAGGELPGFQYELDELVLAGVVDVAVTVEVLHQGQGTLVGCESHRARARVSIHKKQMDGVGTDV
ncbi:hypothetical protein StoSoilB20_34510 [Arthrobacter sp. StoSoilB20]|nr:hypothetical protein StoSoilB20_34510 [Arthrobacter sp. StoSoilB20]